ERWIARVFRADQDFVGGVVLPRQRREVLVQTGLVALDRLEHRDRRRRTVAGQPRRERDEHRRMRQQRDQERHGGEHDEQVHDSGQGHAPSSFPAPWIVPGGEWRAAYIFETAWQTRRTDNFANCPPDRRAVAIRAREDVACCGLSL